MPCRLCLRQKLKCAPNERLAHPAAAQAQGVTQGRLEGLRLPCRDRQRTPRTSAEDGGRAMNLHAPAAAAPQLPAQPMLTDRPRTRPKELSRPPEPRLRRDS